MYLGALGTMIALAAVGRLQAGRFPPRRVLLLLGGLSLPFVVDGTNSFLHLFEVGLHLYEPVNWLRMATGLLLGIGLGTVVLVGFNQNAWRQPTATAPIESLGQVLLAIGLMALLWVAVLTENPILLYPLALASGAGVLLLLTTVHTTLVLLIGRRENQAESWSDLVGPISLGLALATLQVAGIDLLRYIATGSWSGFSL